MRKSCWDCFLGKSKGASLGLTSCPGSSNQESWGCREDIDLGSDLDWVISGRLCHKGLLKDAAGHSETRTASKPGGWGRHKREAPDCAKSWRDHERARKRVNMEHIPLLAGSSASSNCTILLIGSSPCALFVFSTNHRRMKMAIKKNEIMSFGAKWLQLEVSQSPKDKY